MAMHNSNIDHSQHHHDPSSQQSYLSGLNPGFTNSALPTPNESGHPTDDYLVHQNEQYPSRPSAASEQGWSDQVNAANQAQQDGSSGQSSTGGLQRSARPAALKIDMASVASGGFAGASPHDMPGSTGADPMSAGPGNATTPHAMQTRFAPDHDAAAV